MDIRANHVVVALGANGVRNPMPGLRQFKNTFAILASVQSILSSRGFDYRLKYANYFDKPSEGRLLEMVDFSQRLEVAKPLLVPSTSLPI